MQQLYAARLPSRTIVDLLPCIETDEVTLELFDRLLAERDRIDKRISDPVNTRDMLDTAITMATDARKPGRPCPR
ncbi:hypothetical protein [Streptomyces sp. NBC_01210]|uniref:hypothetical protein n=1 Tax=Streptomyces sp. NBC_01210 TaxID=2903774 RepID=UPI003FA38306